MTTTATRPLRVLVACEFSGTVRNAFAALGHHAVSCDLLPSESPGLHYQGDVRDLLDGWEPVQFQAGCDPDGDGWCQVTDSDPAECACLGPTQDDVEYRETATALLARPKYHKRWDLMIAHPPCTYLSSSGLHWNMRRPGRQAQTDEAVLFVQDLLTAPIPRIAVENPIGCLSTRIRKPDQIIQPWQYGHDASKATCLWLVGLPLLRPTDVLPGGAKARRANQTASGQNKLGPSPDRWKLRSMTYPGIAAAMAAQWGGVIA
ncbi:MAG: DNA cytosine methyltransferase [Gammaproteobacteria bacterium PRO9]|nr:DNA cytosine methyltransferase [Gammaproteobacteria bacterium PRO9]